jgi:hypothetical protein
LAVSVVAEALHQPTHRFQTAIEVKALPAEPEHAHGEHQRFARMAATEEAETSAVSVFSSSVIPWEGLSGVRSA